MQVRILLYSYDNREPSRPHTVEVRSAKAAEDRAHRLFIEHSAGCDGGCFLDRYTVDRQSSRTHQWRNLASGRLANDRII